MPVDELLSFNGQGRHETSLRLEVFSNHDSPGGGALKHFMHTLIIQDFHMERLWISLDSLPNLLEVASRLHCIEGSLPSDQLLLLSDLLSFDQMH